MERLIKYIENIYYLKCVDEKLTEEEEEELKFLEKFIKDFNLNDVVSVVNIDRHNLVTAILDSLAEDGSLEIIKKNVELLKLDGITDYHDIYNIHEKISDSEKNDTYTFIKEIPFDYKDDDLNVKELKSLGKLDDLKELHKMLKESIAQTEDARKVFFILYELYPTVFTSILLMVAILNNNMLKINLSSDKKEINSTTNIKGYNKNGINYEKIKTFIMNSLDTCRFNEKCNMINKKINHLKALPKERANANRNIKRKKEKIVKALTSLDTSKQITFSSSFLDSIGDDKIKYYIIRRALSLNLKIQNTTIEQLKTEEQKTTIEKFFKKSCFSFDNLTDLEQINLSTYGNISEIEKMLEIFTNSNISIYNDSFPIYDILMLSKSSIVSTITKLVEAKVITEDFVLKNPSIFVENIPNELLSKVSIKDSKYNILISNINLFKDKKFDTRAISKFDSNILLRDKEYNSQVINLINLYKLDYNNCNNYSLLTNPKLITIADKFIELGLGNYIRKHPYMINSRANIIIERLQLLKQLDIPLIIENKLNPKVTQKEFKLGKNIINDESIKDFIPNSSEIFTDDEMVLNLNNQKDIFNIEEISDLEKYAIDDYVYDFDGVIISKLKVLRNYNILKSKYEDDDKKILLNSIIYQSTLDEEMIEKISNCLTKTNTLKIKRC